MGTRGLAGVTCTGWTQAQLRGVRQCLELGEAASGPGTVLSPSVHVVEPGHAEPQATPRSPLLGHLARECSFQQLRDTGEGAWGRGRLRDTGEGSAQGQRTLTWDLPLDPCPGIWSRREPGTVAPCDQRPSGLQWVPR